MNNWSLLIGGLVGLALTLFGVRMLVTGRGPAPILRAFRSVRDAAFYHLLFGVALMTVCAGTYLPGGTSGVTAVAAVVIVLVAVIRYRPRAKKEEPAKPVPKPLKSAPTPEEARAHAEKRNMRAARDPAAELRERKAADKRVSGS